MPKTLRPLLESGNLSLVFGYVQLYTGGVSPARVDIPKAALLQLGWVMMVTKLEAVKALTCLTCLGYISLLLGT